jgi:hypothetical protein
MSLAVVNVEVCHLCDQFVNIERRNRDMEEIALLGAERYAWCVACGQQVPQPWSEDYMRAWRRLHRSQQPRIPPGTVSRLRQAWRAGADAHREGKSFWAAEGVEGLEREAWVEGHEFSKSPTCSEDHGFRRWLQARRLR